MALEQQMEMNFGNVPDNTVGVDPVSGNEIPLGSNAENVRDDIPANLSEGEIVIPADVANYWGVKLFEDLRAQAKMGYAQMAQDGRMGGEPMMEDMDIELTIEDLDVMDDEEPVLMNRGGMNVERGRGNIYKSYSAPGTRKPMTAAQHQAKIRGGSFTGRKRKPPVVTVPTTSGPARPQLTAKPATSDTVGPSIADQINFGGKGFDNRDNTSSQPEMSAADRIRSLGGNKGNELSFMQNLVKGTRDMFGASEDVSNRRTEDEEEGLNVRYHEKGFGQRFMEGLGFDEGGLAMAAQETSPSILRQLSPSSMALAKHMSPKRPKMDFTMDELREKGLQVEPKPDPSIDRTSKDRGRRGNFLDRVTNRGLDYIFPHPTSPNTAYSPVRLSDVRGDGEYLINPDRKKMFDGLVERLSESEKAQFDKMTSVVPSSPLYAERQRQEAINKILSQREGFRNNIRPEVEPIREYAERVRQPQVDPRQDTSGSGRVRRPLRPMSPKRPTTVKGPEDFENRRQYYRYLRQQRRRQRLLERKRRRNALRRYEMLRRLRERQARLANPTDASSPFMSGGGRRRQRRGFDEGGLANPEPFYSQKGGFDLSHMKVRGTTVQEYQNDEGHRIFITFLNGVPQMEIPEGYFPVGDPINVNRLVNYSIPRMDGISPQPVSTYTEEEPQRSSGGGGGSSSTNIMDTVEAVNYKELSVDELKAMITDQNTLGSKIFGGLSPITKLIMWDKTRRTKAEIERRLEDPETSEVDKIRLNNLLDLANREEPGLIKTLLDKATGKEFERIVSQIPPPVKLDYDFSDPTLAPDQGIGDVYTPNPQEASRLTTPGVDGVPLTRSQIDAGKKFSEEAAEVAFTPKPTQDKPKTEVEKMRSDQEKEDKVQKAKDRGKAFKDTADAAGSSIADLGRLLSPSDEKENIDYGDPRRGMMNKGGIVKKKKSKKKKSK